MSTNDNLMGNDDEIAPKENRPDFDPANMQISVGEIAESKNIAIGSQIQQTIYEGYSADEVASLLKSSAVQFTTTNIPEPPRPARPPDTSSFLGRDEDIAYFAQKLESFHEAVITGMAGVGKSMLAAKLAQQHPVQALIFWHSFHEDEDAQTVIWKLAGFLYWHGEQELWRKLHANGVVGMHPLPPEILIDYVVQVVRSQKFLLCFDDFQFVQDDPFLSKMVDQIRIALRAGEFKFIIVSRTIPTYIQITDFRPLSGLTKVETDQLLKHHDINLAENAIEILQQQTEGNAQLVTLAIQALKYARNHEPLLARLIESRDVRRFLMNEVANNLTKSEQIIMEAVSLFRGYAVTVEAVEAVLDDSVGFGIWEELLNLSDRFLLQNGEEDDETVYSQHSMVQAYFYKNLNKRRRLEMHNLAAGYFEDQQVEPLQAARHYLYAGEETKSAALATQNLWLLINRYQAQPLANLLDLFRPNMLSAQEWVQCNLSRGTIHSFLGNRAMARACYETALADIDSLPPETERCTYQVKACREMGRLLYDESPQEALDWLQRGVNILKTCEALDAEITLAAFYIDIGWTHKNLDNLASALDGYTQGLELLPSEASRLRGEALNGLAACYLKKADVQNVLLYGNQALENSRLLNDAWQELQVLSNLSGAKFVAQKWLDAAEDGVNALQLAERLQNKKAQAALAVSLGNCYINLGATEKALRQLQEGLTVVQELNIPHYELITHRHLAKLFVRLQQWQSAAIHLEAAENLASTTGNRLLILIYRSWAELHLGQQAYQKAKEYIDQSIALAVENNLQTESGKSHRVLGQIQAAMDQQMKSEVAFRRSIDLLANKNGYETARTQAKFGEMLIHYGAVDKGKQFLLEASNTFKKMSAAFDLAQIKELADS